MTGPTRYAQSQVRRAWRWWTEPFRTQVDIYERTRIEWRLFPPKIHVQAIPLSIQQAVDAAKEGDTISIRPGRIHVTEPVDLTGHHDITLRDMYVVGHGQYVIKAGVTP